MVERSPAGASLASIRRDLEEIDRAIVLLVAARIDAAGRAIRCRSQVDGRIANPEQEARVIARAQAWGAPFGLAPEFTETIFRAIVESGKERFASVARSGGPATLARYRGRGRTRMHLRSPSPSLARAAAPAPS